MSTIRNDVSLPGSAKHLLSRDDCEITLRRTCFGHLALPRDGNVDVLPIRYAWVDNWVYFRATPGLRDVIAHHPWVVLSVTELEDVTHVRSVIVRGGCYATEETGSPEDDASAMRGVVALRDRPAVGRTSAAHRERTTTVFRLHADEIEGRTLLVPCPAGERDYDDAELQQLRDVARSQTVADDERADDDGMATQAPPAAPRTPG